MNVKLAAFIQGYLHTSDKVSPYMSGYLQKSAVADSIIEAGAAAGGKTIHYGVMLSVLVPLVTGALAGAAASRLTSPVGKKDVVQKSLVAAELEEAAAELQRKRKLDMQNEATLNGEVSQEKPIHIR